MGDAVSWRDKSALIVDDNVVDRLVLKSLLKKIGFKEIQEAEDGSMASFKISNAIRMSAPFDVIFLDYRMPRTDGLSLLKEIRSDRLAKRARVLMVTGHAEKEAVEDTLLAGADDYIVKPVEWEVLETKLKKLF